MNFKINRNGNSHADMRDQFYKLHDQAQRALDMLQEMDVFHQRNYQTLPDADEAWAADVENYEEMQRHALALREFARSGAAEVIRQREDL